MPGYFDRSTQEDITRLYLPSTATEWEEKKDSKTGIISSGDPIAGEEWVDLRKPRYGDRLKAQTSVAIVKPDPMKGGQVIQDIDSNRYMTTLMTRLIVKWSLTEDGQATADLLLELEPEDGDYLANKVNGMMGGSPKPEDLAPFTNGSGQHLVQEGPKTKKSSAS
jgi:hypothetical protein